LSEKDSVSIEFFDLEYVLAVEQPRYQQVPEPAQLAVGFDLLHSTYKRVPLGISSEVGEHLPDTLGGSCYLDLRMQLLHRSSVPYVGSTAALYAGFAYLTVLSILPYSTEGENNRRVVVVAVVLAHGADLPVSVKTRPWRLRTERLPELPEKLELLLIAKHCLASRDTVEMEHEFGLVLG
jgi:hypothetical protein